MNNETENAVSGTGPMSSVTRDVQGVRNNSAATAKELRSFLLQMKGRSPAEMLGMVAQSSLFKSLITATVLMALLMVVCTIIPFGMAKLQGGATDEAVVVDEVAGPVVPPPAEIAPVEQVKETSVEEALGIGDALDAPVDANPLENSADDLFKDLE